METLNNLRRVSPEKTPEHDGGHVAADNPASSVEAFAFAVATSLRFSQPRHMATNPGAAEALAIVGDEARRLLTSVERPIVAMPKRLGERRANRSLRTITNLGLLLTRFCTLAAWQSMAKEVEK